MKQQIKEIAEGWKNTFLLASHVEIMAAKRIAICLEEDGDEPHCRFYNEKGSILGAKCESCGCPLKMKTRSESSKCPEKKW